MYVRTTLKNQDLKFMNIQNLEPKTRILDS